MLWLGFEPITAIWRVQTKALANRHFYIMLLLRHFPKLSNFNLFRLVLINAIYFKGDWARKFRPESTRKGTFHLADGSTVETDMMFMNEEFRLANLQDINARALEMPYKGGRLSMIFVLPQETLAKTESSLANFDFNSIKFGPPIKCDVHIPKFKIESTHELNDPLKGLGLTDMFDEEKADFSGELSLAVLRRIYHYGR